MKKCPDCGIRFYESTAPFSKYTDDDGRTIKRMQCPRCYKYGPFENVEVEDLWV